MAEATQQDRDRVKMTRTLEDWVEYIYDMSDPPFFPTRERLVCEINSMLELLSDHKNWQHFKMYGYHTLIHWERYFPAFVRTAFAQEFAQHEVPTSAAKSGGHLKTRACMLADIPCSEQSETSKFMATFHALVLQRLAKVQT
jgi:hypothetical protein